MKVILDAAQLVEVNNDQVAMNMTLNFLRNEGVYSKKLLDCIQKCLNGDYKQRYTLEEIERTLFTE
jgi:hypothetical protein